MIDVEPGSRDQSTPQADVARRRVRTLTDVTPKSQNPRMARVIATIRRAAHSNAPILLRGETGTGKSTFAEVLHSESPRRASPFVVVDCPTLSDALFASELFGHGTETAAVTQDQAGRIEAATGGTLFLDEIGEMPLSVQSKLLRFLDKRRYEETGGGQSSSCDVRVVAATNRRIEDDVKNGRFRLDLFFRLNVVEIDIPPLRERPEDILPIARHFIEVFSAQHGRPVQQLSKGAVQLLSSYAWPGNVRELRNTIEQVVMLCSANVIEAEAFPVRLAGATRPQPSIGGDFAVDEIEQEHIMRVIRRTPTLERAAVILGIDYTTLWRKRKRYLSADSVSG